MTATTNDVFAALANPTRRELLRLLLDGPQPVAQMAARFEMARPSVSEHLRVLREAGLVTERKTGRQRYYQLEAGPLRELSEWLHPYERFWREKLTSLRGFLDEVDGDRHPDGATDDGTGAREGGAPHGGEDRRGADRH